ncbi:MAG: PLDc N-terminal domain-containing protein [Elusimicrobiaceae bacterium]|nr:PLDc N-terminal domain-containing protein [Elusimicrobiaceae bacterium]
MNFFSLTLAGFFLLCLQITVTFHILMHKEDVPSAIGWIGLVWLAPVVGSVAYIILGINRIRRKALRLQNRGKNPFTASGKTPQDLEKEIPPSVWQLLHLGYKTHPQHLSLGNLVLPLLNGDEAYLRMCQVISQAKKEVMIASYIFNNDKAGQMFVSALQKAAQNGAKMRILVDGVGLNYSRPNIYKALKHIKGLEFAAFLPSKSPVNLPFVNLRNHRKIMVIDGEIAFFGGMNISEGNLLNQNPQEPIQDITFEIQGPVISQISNIFEEDWAFSTQQSLLNKNTRPPQQSPCKGATPMRLIPDGPDGDFGKVERMCLGALACAQKKVSIVTPYFLPENNILSALETASLRGVEVEIILPEKSNILGMDWAMQANFLRLLEKGVKIYRSAPPFDHSKLFLIDEVWLFSGSANWDVRSFKLNFESNMECFDPMLAKQVQHIVEAKKKKARLLSKTHYIQLTWWKQLRNNAFRLLTPYY